MVGQVIPLVLLGLVVGPFLGLIVDRAVERERPQPFLRCPACSESLGRWSLAPLVAWFTTCRNGHRNWRYPLTDISTAVLFGLAGWRFGYTWQLGPYLVFFAALVVLSVVDLEHKLLLNVLTYPLLGFTAFCVLALSTPNDWSEAIWPALVAGVGYGLFFLFANLIYPDGMGLGDVKLAPSLGLFIGWTTTSLYTSLNRMFGAVLIALITGGVIGMIIQRSRKAEVPFGPFMVLGTVAVLAYTA